MELSTVEIPRAQAREKAAAYMREAKRESNPARRREFEEIGRAYRIAARDEVALIALTPTITAGGTVTRTRVFRPARGEEYRLHYLLPAIAVARWDAAYVYTMGVQRTGAIALIDSLGRGQSYRKGLVTLDTGFEFPVGVELLSSEWAARSGYVPGREARPSREAWRAMVPIVPPEHRPGHGMGDRLVLFEADDWQWAQHPTPPGDPALLRHVGGDIYAVEAVWDLTELEKLVLSGRRPE